MSGEPNRPPDPGRLPDAPGGPTRRSGRYATYLPNASRLPRVCSVDRRRPMQL